MIDIIEENVQRATIYAAMGRESIKQAQEYKKARMVCYYGSGTRRFKFTPS